jgi:hypothetical protein
VRVVRALDPELTQPARISRDFEGNSGLLRRSAINMERLAALAEASLYSSALSRSRKAGA